MATEPSHIQLTEYRKTTIPYLNWMFEDIFCLYGVSIPFYLLDFSFPDNQVIAEWPAPYSPEWLELYKPSLPAWPEMPWWNIPGMLWPEMDWPLLPRVQWPRLPDMPWPEFPPWPGMDLQEWERFKLEWPEWDWPNWELPESKNTRWRDRRKRLVRELHKTRKVSLGITLRKPPIGIIQEQIQEQMREYLKKMEEIEQAQILEYPEKPIWLQVQKSNWFEGTAPDWVADFNGFNFGSDWGESGYNLPWLNELLGLAFDAADLPRWTMPDFSPASLDMLNSKVSKLYEKVTWFGTFDPETVSPNLLQRRGWGDTCSLAWDKYVNDPDWQLVTATGTRLDWAGHCYYIYPHSRVIGKKNYLLFDTSLASPNGNSLVLKFDVTYVLSPYDWLPNGRKPVIYVYNQDWGADVDSSDWTGGTKVGELEVTSTGIKEITLNISAINVGGNTKFRIALKDCEEHSGIFDPGEDYIDQIIKYSDMQLVWSKE